jgi:hypothetical protein
LFSALTGNGGVKIDIRLTPQQQQQQQGAGGIIPMDHYPSWKLHKNPFWRVKHPNGTKLASVAPSSITGELQPNSQLFSYEAHQDIGGVVSLHLAPGKKVEHLGIKIQFIGRIDMVRTCVLEWNRMEWGLYWRKLLDCLASCVAHFLSNVYYVYTHDFWCLVFGLGLWSS